MSDTNNSSNMTALGYLAEERKKYPPAPQDSIDALRSAVVAQTALLRSLSEQVRIGNEAHYAILKANQTLLQAIDAVGDANRLECQTSFAALAERLDKLEGPIVELEQKTAYQKTLCEGLFGLEKQIGGLSTSLAEYAKANIEAKLPARKDLKAGRRGKVKR